ncbi:MAG TPA: HAD family hydrolase [Gaiellaceae bacterium]|jgi:HAD superfamily hydrolase (TIGR01509 family)|nr:HAD family hydrolase [Gaiellaceae bacterium]
MTPPTQAATTIILDVDGTLVDTNYHHTLAWARALREHECVVPLWRIHRATGMGGDKLVAHVAGSRFDTERGDDVREAETRLYGELIGEVEPLDGARELLVELESAGRTVVLASSAKQPELDHYLDLLDARELVDAWTSAADVDATKPDPELVRVALAKAGAVPALMVGDTTWDIEAATSAGIPTACVTTGGFSKQELLDGGAVAVHESLDELRKWLRISG